MIYLTAAVQVGHSQAFKEKPHLEWLLIKADREVLCALHELILAKHAHKRSRASRKHGNAIKVIATNSTHI